MICLSVHSGGLIGSLAEPICKVNFFPQQSKVSLTGKAVEYFEYNLSYSIVEYYWLKFVKKQEKYDSDQMVLVYSECFEVKIISIA